MKSKKAGAPALLTLDQKKTIAKSFFLYNRDNPAMLRRHGIYTRLMEYANENVPDLPRKLTNINIFSEDDQFTTFLEYLLSSVSQPADPTAVTVTYEHVDVDSFLRKSKAELRGALLQLDDTTLRTFRAAELAISDYQAVCDIVHNQQKQI